MTRTARTSLQGTTLLGAALGLLLAAAPLEAQHTLGSGLHFQGLSFDGAQAPAQAADLWVVPLAYRYRISDRLSADLYTAWASGTVESGGENLELDGFVDTELRASYQATPWAMLSLAVNLPTGNSELTDAESRVASFLSSDLFGFRHSTWGQGLGVTTGIATARRVGEWGVGAGLSYRYADDFEPRAGQSLRYEPGDELRVRLGLDRNVGENAKLTAGLMFQNFQTDQSDGRNLFQAGNRIRGDLSYRFRYQGAPWTLYAMNVWREEGDLFILLVDDDENVVGEDVVETGSQNLLVLGVSGAQSVGSREIRPHLDVRWQDRSTDVGSGWMSGVGAEMPLRLFGRYEVLPRARFLFGGLEVAPGDRPTFIGAQVGATIRWRM